MGVGDELGEGLVQHRPAPDDGLLFVDEEADLWVPETVCTSCDVLVLVNESAEPGSTVKIGVIVFSARRDMADRSHAAGSWVRPRGSRRAEITLLSGPRAPAAGRHRDDAEPCGHALGRSP